MSSPPGAPRLYKRREQETDHAARVTMHDDQLERTVTTLGFKGAMVHGLTNGVFFDDERFWPIFARAGLGRATLRTPSRAP